MCGPIESFIGIENEVVGLCWCEAVYLVDEIRDKSLTSGGIE